MGKGDKRSRKGKVWRGSFGNTRRKKEKNKPAFVPKPKVKKVAPPVQLDVNPAEAPVTEVMGTAQGGEAAAAKPKKVAAKKPKAEGEKKPAVKKEPKKKAPTEKKDKE